MIRKLFVQQFALLMMTCLSVFGQTDSTSQQTDSLTSAALRNYNLKLAQVEQQRQVDSLKRVELEARLNSLKTTDNLKKEELQQQLQALNDKEIRRIAQKKARIDSLRQTVKSYPVKGFFDDTLFVIYSKFGSFSAKDRAEAISSRIQKLKDTYGFRTIMLKVEEAETTDDIVFDESIVMSVSENDAIWNNKPRKELAEEYRLIIGQAVENYLAETSFVTLAKEFGLALLVIIGAGICIMYLIRLFRWTASEIQAQEGKRFNGFNIRNYSLFDARHQVNFFLNINTIVKWILMIVLIYIALPLLFGIFPWTEGLANTLFGYILDPLKDIVRSVWGYLPNLFTILVIVTVFIYLLKGLRFLKDEVENGDIHLTGFYPDWANPTFQIVRVLLLAFMLILVFPYLPNSDSDIFKGVSVFLGFLFTFGSAGSLSNIIAGLVLTYMRLFKLGDRVKIGDEVGDVIEKSLLVTRIRTPKNEIVSVPNSTVMSSPTVNYSSETLNQGLILHTTITIGYDVPWKDIHQALLTAADRTDLLLKEPKPFVLQTSLDDFYVAYQVNAYTREANRQAGIYSSLHQNIQDCCNESGIEILSPHYRAARDGSMTTIPANYLDKDYEAPGFNVNLKKN
ncbi:mechanosensitive ion channel family protein [Persicitalea jodogahamensis]|uniref:Ion channel n=1 Tax=Persicitalea jodogahamensis TaxID=402147 RepID=A0A8J3GB65_9BACT|nr:mechanosensitive ion channel family protein [Persicitalea jodogahamensis]GHB79598.1 ion channel [Persicitalea jodogahamensis]